MSYRMKTRLLVAIWGERYVDEFSRVSLPSYLAKNNIGALAEATDLEVVVLTAKDSVKHFGKSRAFAKLRSICPVKFIYIDDLIAPGNYGVTLTLAYARGIIDVGQEQTETYFVFMNSDFVLSDGALRTLATKISEGVPCIMAPSLRACSETTLPILESAVDRKKMELAMPARQMVKVTFDNLHPTVIGKTISQNFANCTTHNQIYLQVDENTLLARYYLIFMLAIRPERPLSIVNSYCDYGFVPDLVPSGRFHILDDSDQFFMLELQPSGQEYQYMRCGASNMLEIASELSQWTTLEHRRFAEVDVVFHSGSLPNNLDAHRRKLAVYMDQLRSHMKKQPVDHNGHFYWEMGVFSWLSLQRSGANQIADIPPELEWTTDGPPRFGTVSDKIFDIRNIFFSMMGKARRFIGERPNVPIWHYSWTDGRLFLDLVARIKSQSTRKNLLVCAVYSSLSKVMQTDPTFDVLAFRVLRDENAFNSWQKEAEDGAGYGNVFCHFRHSDIGGIKKVLENVTERFRDADNICVYIDQDPGEFVVQCNYIDLSHSIQNILPGSWLGYDMSVMFSGGAIKKRLRDMEVGLVRRLWPITMRRAVAYPIVVLMLPIVAILISAFNLLAKRGSVSQPLFCSSAILIMCKKR